jgi:hypothetical protein
VAYLVKLQPCECQVCGKPATVTLYSDKHIKIGDYCTTCGQAMKIDAHWTELYAQ